MSRAIEVLRKDAAMWGREIASRQFAIKKLDEQIMEKAKEITNIELQKVTQQQHADHAQAYKAQVQIAIDLIERNSK